ncbi:TorF family putative porin [Massilia endophytica]|uniref:TorF family putative porin n=1 Tax=Massilia endophytica TaxID=2899220 RepID=UPI001E442104|nr:TorF family putative porin [Massilia endophytica]UGQ48840.1 TorF family putative porin [Massilia endophytica]
MSPQPPQPKRLCALPGLLLLVLAAPASAQLSGSVSVVTDYRFRGAVLSETDPSLQASLAYDSGTGWYTGAFAAQTRVSDRGGAQLVGYAGYARRMDSGLSWDAGVSATRLTQSASSYAEAYIGLSGEQLSARLSYAPHYLGRSLQTVYAEVNAVQPLEGGLSLFAHAGLLHGISGQAFRQRADLRLGAAARLGDATLQLWYERSSRRSRYGEESYSPHALVLGARYDF